MRRTVVAALLAVALGAGLGLAGDLPVRGARKGKATPSQLEDAILRSDLATMRAVRERTALYVVVAESRQDWDRWVGPGLDRALSASPEALEEFARGLPEGITVLGPRIAGARVQFDLPGGRGRGALGLYLPELLLAGHGDLALLDSREPNQGRFVSGIAVTRARSESGEQLRSVDAPSLPRAVEGVEAPRGTAKEPPGSGRGDLVLWGGRAASGGESEELLEALDGWIEREDLPTQPMRSFPGRDGDLAKELRSFRVIASVPVATDGWVRTLSLRPDRWEMETRKVKHPSRVTAGVAPVTTLIEVDGAREERSIVVGFWALYTPLLLSAEEAPLLSGVDAATFFAAVHRGEIPFLRDRDDLWFLRGHVARWASGEARTPSGKARTHGEAVEQVRTWGERYGLRGVERIARGPLPFRFEAIPDAELEQMVDRSRAARGRVFADDLAAWVRHQDETFEKATQDPVYVLAAPGTAVSVRATLRRGPNVEAPRDEGGPSPDAEAVAARPPSAATPSAATPSASTPSASTAGASTGKGLVKASDVGFSGGAARRSEDAVADLDLDSRGWEDDGAGPEVARPNSYGIEAGRMGGSVSGSSEGSEGRRAIEVRDVYTASALCRLGGQAEVGVELRITGLGEDAIVPIRIEWDLLVGGRSLKRDAFTERRGDGVHEFEFPVPCGETAGAALLSVTGFLGEEAGAPSDSGETPLDLRGGTGRSFAPLVMPSPKRCLASSLELADDEEFGVATSAGLDAVDITTAVRAFQEQTLRCYEGAAEVSGSVQLELSVGCDGRVSQVEVVDTTIGDARFVACVAETMGFAPFPAHDRPDGAVFEIPLRYE